MIFSGCRDAMGKGCWHEKGSECDCECHAPGYQSLLGRRKALDLVRAKRFQELALARKG